MPQIRPARPQNRPVIVRRSCSCTNELRHTLRWPTFCCGSGVLTSDLSHGASKTVLVVDDEPAVAELARAVLERCGWQVVVSLERRKACDLLRAAPGQFSLILSDIVMPFMSAHEFLLIARAANPHLRFVMMSGHPQEFFDDIPFTSELLFLQKPFTPSQLLDVVANVKAAPRVEADAQSAPSPL